jgi:BlaI family penicillinase repressor
MTETRLGRVQLRIMRVLWQRGRANAREITDALNAEEPIAHSTIAHSTIAHSTIAHSTIAHSTVQTLLRQLEEKGSVAHDVMERSFIYYPLVQEARVTHSATRELIDRVFGGDAAGLVAYLLREERIPRKELRALRELIEEMASGRGREKSN